MISGNRVRHEPKQSVISAFISAFISALMWTIVFAALVFSSKTSRANEVAHCSLEFDDEKRHACFQSNPQQTYDQLRPGWPVLSFRSYASGNLNASATRTAEQLVMCGDTEGAISLGLHCVDDGMKVVFSLGCAFGNPNTPAPLELLTDTESSLWKAKVFRNQLGMSIDDAILAKKFVKSMQGHEKVVLVFEPKNAPKFVATFNLNGFDKAIERVGKLCPL